jgi:hypothetical protein
MSRFPARRLWPLGGVAIAVAVVLAFAGSTPRPTLGQSASPTVVVTATGATPAVTTTSITSTSAAQPAPPIDNETAVRAILPDSIRDSVRLPVYKWARADMPDAPGGYVVFIATVYPLRDDAGNVSDWLLANYLQWDGSEWLLGLSDYQGRKLMGDDAWMAENLTDITALPSAPGQSWRVFTVAYTADGTVSPGFTRTETLVEIYDLTLTTVWSRIDYLRENDSTHAGYVKQHAEDVDWNFQDLDGNGISSLVATVTDVDTITQTDAADSTTPPSGTTRNVTTEVYKWLDGVYIQQRQPAAGNQPMTGGPLPAAPSPTATPRPNTVPRATPTPQPTGTPSG